MLFPLARLLTPNAAEAEVLTGISVIDTRSAKLAAEKLLELGLKNVLIKGGHVAGPDVIDVLFTNNEVYELEQKRINTKNTHGTGCVYSAAITANLALGDSIVTAVSKANDFVHRAIETNPNLGHGFGPINMFASPKMTNS